MIPRTDLDYVEFYAEKLRADNRYFAQQKLLIESQLQSSRELFRQRFGKDFKRNARIYLREIGLLH